MTIDTNIKTGHNIPLYSVSELSKDIKQSIEEKFSYVKIKGEISGMKIAPSGHVYLSLKDDSSLISAVCWRGNFAKIGIKPEDGLEVIAIGKITTYAGQSKYQLIINSMEHAGIGSLMAMLNKRKEQFSKEGLFNAEHKKKLPFMPTKIGVITSPTGAVIRDILHRISDRLPTRVILWPVLVQGDKAAEQISSAIDGFSHLPKDHDLKPDVLIIARGGGSFEDLWCFNEENVVKSTFNCNIPLISAVGHETDVTLIDHVSDVRAPTPTAAAEIATAVRNDLLLMLKESEKKLHITTMKIKEFKAQKLENLTNSLKNKSDLLNMSEQKLDEISFKIEHIFKSNLKEKLSIFKTRSILLKSPDALINKYETNLQFKFSSIKQKINHYFASYEQKSNYNNLSIKRLKNIFKNAYNSNISINVKFTELNILNNKLKTLKNSEALLKSYDYHNVLERGFSLIKDGNNIVTSISNLMPNKSYEIIMKDGKKISTLND